VTRNVLVTGVGRRRGIGAGIAAGLAKDGWDLTLSYRRPYDERLGLEGQPDDPEQLASELRRAGRRIELIEADLERPSTLTG
jgi:3-oxoacyl-[acyl-carrier protein] reductase